MVTRSSRFIADSRRMSVSRWTIRYSPQSRVLSRSIIVATSGSGTNSPCCGAMRVIGSSASVAMPLARISRLGM